MAKDETEAQLEKSGRVEELIRLYEGRSREVPSADEAGHLLSRAGELAREKLKNLARAEELYRRALVYAPNAKEALEGLRALYEQRNDSASLADVIERLAAATEGPAAAQLYLKAAALFETKLQRRDRAVLCCQLASKAAPQERQAFQMARRLLLADGRYLPAFESLERERGILGERDLLEEYLAFAENLVDDPHQHELVNKALERVLTVDPKNAKAATAKAAAEKLPEVWKDKVRELRSKSLDERDRRTAARLSLQVAKLFSFFEPTSTQKVKEALDRCFLLWPAMPDALDLLERVAEKSGDFKVAVAVFTKLAADTKDKQAQVDLLLRVGTVQLSKLGNAAAAVEFFDKASKLDPARADAAGSASEQLIEQGKVKEGLDVLERHLAALKEKDAKVALHLRLADLWQGMGKEPAAARKHLEGASKLDPTNATAAFRLARVLADAEDLEPLWQTLELASSAPRPAKEKVGFLEGVATLYEDAGQLPKAFQALAWALPLEPDRPGLLDALTEMANKAQAQPQLAQSLKRAATLAADPLVSARLWGELAQLLQGPLGRPVDALEAWHEVARKSPNDLTAEQAIQAIQKSLVEAPQDPRSKLEAEARRLESTAADPVSAAEVYRKILELEPDSVPTLKKLGAAYTSLGQWDNVAVVAERLMALAESGTDRAEWRSRLAQLYAERLNRREEAAKLFLQLLAEGAESAAVIGGLERLAAQGIRQAEISRALAPQYAKAGDYQRQVASLLVQLSSVQEKDEQKGLLELLADTTEKRLLDERSAYEYRLRGLALDPGDSTFRAEALRLARAQKVHAEYSRFLAEQAAKVEDPALGRSLTLDAAEVAAEGGAVDDSASALRAALNKNADDIEVLSRLSALYLKAGRLSDADGVLRRQLLLAEESEKPNLYLQLANVSSSLSRPREAAIALAEAIKGGANEAEHLPRLAELLEMAGKAEELAHVLARLIALAEKEGDAEKAHLLSLKRAKLEETSLGNKAGALKHYAEVLTRKASDPEAISALENLMGDEAMREDAARALLPAYDAVKDHRKMVGALSAIASCTKDGLEKLNALKSAARIHSHHLRQPEQAFAAMAEALRLVPDDQEIRAQTRAAAEEADLLDSYAELVNELFEGLSKGVALGLHKELADVYEKKLNDQANAVKHLVAVLSADPKNLDALKALHRLHRAREEWQELVPVVEMLAAAAADPVEKTELDREAAMLCEQKLGDLERSAVNWRQIAARDVLAKDAATALDRLYLKLDRPQELAFALELRRNQEGQSPQGRELAFRLAQLRLSKLNDPAGALQMYRQILTEDPSHPGATEALENWARSDSADSAAAIEILDPVLARSGDHARRIAIRESRFTGATQGERMRLSAEIRAIYERDMGQPQAAFMQALKAFTEGIDREGVRPELERLARETEAFEELAEIYESTAETSQDEQQVLLYRRAAEIREQLQQPDDAIRNWKTLLELQPQDRQALDSLSRLFEKSQNAKSLSEVLQRKAQVAQDPSERFELLMKAGEAFEASGNDNAAIDAFKSALALKRSNEAFVSLDRLFGKAKRLSEQADVLDQLASMTNDETLRLSYLLRRAQLLEREGQHVEALRAFGTVLEVSALEANAVAGLERLMAVEPVRPDAARLLEPCYRRLKDLKKLVEVLEVRVGIADPNLRLPLLTEIAVLREGLGQKPLAFASRLRAFSEAPDDEGTREELERLAADLGAFEELAAAYEDALERGADGPLADDLWRRLAGIYGDRLQRLDLAARAWNEVLTRDPRNLFVLDQLARIFRKTSDFKNLSLVMRRQLALEANVTAQVSLLFELANLAEETLSDKALAAQCYQEILERRPEEPNAIKFLARVLSETERYPELAVLIGREIQLAEGKGATEQALELMVRLGRLKLSRLNDPRGALSQFQEVLKRKAAHAGAVGALEEMARSDSPLKGEAASTLEPVFAGEGEHLKLVQMLESRVSSEPDPRERVGLLKKIAEVYTTQMDNAEMAFVTAARALRELPDDEGSLELSLKLYQRADAIDEMVALLTEVAPKAADDGRRAELYRALARIAAVNDESEESIEAWKRVLELVPTDPEALESVGKLLGKGGRVQELIDVLKRQLAMADDPQQRAGLLFQMGSLQQDYLKDQAGALATFRRLLEISPEEPQALERMDRLCEAQERWPELADVLARRLKVAQGDALNAAKYRLGLVRETKLLDKAGAIELYTDLLASDPRSSGALTRMEAIVAKEPQNAVAVGVLLTAYRALGDLVKLATVIEARVAVSPDGYERKLLLTELASVRDAQDEPELAFLALWRAFKEDPNDAELRKRLETTAEAAKSYEELVSAYEDELPRIAEAQDAATICLKVGQILDTKLREADRAVGFYEKAREVYPEVGNRALPALDRIYGNLGSYEQQAGVLDALASLAPEAQERVALLFRLGQLAMDKLDSPDRAAAAFEKILTLDGRHLPSLRALEQLYDTAQTHEKLYRVLEAQKDIVQGAERERILQRIASVAAEGLGNVEESISVYRELLQKNPRNEQAFAQLEKLLEKAGQAEELYELLKGKLSHTVDPRELVRLNERVGRVLFTQLGRAEDAIAYFKAALERDARHKGALECLRDIFEQLERKDDLVIVLRRLIPLQEDATGVKGLRIRLGEVLALGGRREEALDAARRALEVEPHAVPELDRVIAIFMGLKAFTDAVRALELKCTVYQGLEDREAAVSTMFQVADLWRGPANKPEACGPALEKILEIDPANRVAYEQALQLYSAVNDWRGYTTAMDRYLSNLVTDEEKVASLKELAQVQEERLGQKDVAFLKLLRAVELAPADHELREQVERLAEETEGFEELATAYEHVADNVPRGPLAERLYLVLAKVQSERLNDLSGAESTLRKILEFDPTNELALDALAQMFSGRGKDKEYIVALEQKLEAAGSIERRKEILREIARVFAEKLGNAREAQAALERALELEPDVATLQSLIALQKAGGDFQSVASSLLRMRDIAPSPEQRSQIQVEVAQLYERDLQDDEAAVEGFRQALEFDPGNAAALDALEQLFTRLNRPADLLSVYERQIELTDDYREKVKIYFKSAQIWEDTYQNLGNADQCIEYALMLDSQNLQAIKTLERLRKAQGRWDELIGVVDRHINLLTHPAEKAELCVEMGDIFHQQLKQVDRAVTAYHQALELDPRCRPAMHALGMLYERSGNWPFALDMLEKEAIAAGNTADAVELFHRMGKINEDMLIDPNSAKRCYLEALKIDPSYLPCIRALKGIYEIEKDWDSFEKALVQEAEQTEDQYEKSKAFAEVARYYLERKEDRDSSTRFYEEALRLDPNSGEAAKPLADVYVAREDWPNAEKMLDIVVLRMSERAAEDQDGSIAKELCRQAYRLGYVCEKLGKKDKALKCYERAWQLDATYLPALEGLGNLLVQAKRFDEALKVYQTILIHHRDDLTDLEVVEIYWTLGDVHLQMRQLDRAQNHFEKALGIDPGHEPSLRSMIAIADQTNAFEKSAEFRQSLLKVLDDEPKYLVAVELGKLAKEKLNDAYMAIDAYLAAVKLNPQVLDVLDALYVLYRETRQAPKAAETLEKMLAVPELQSDTTRLKRVWFALGEIARDELNDLDKAEAAFNAALDADWHFIEAFSALEAMLGKNKMWQSLEQNYHRMIKRLPKSGDTHLARMELFKAMGALYQQKLKRPDAAVEVFKVVAMGLPEDAQVQEMFAELASEQQGYEESATEAYRRALPATANPGKVASALAALAAKRKDYDSAWLAAQVVSGLIGDVGPNEREILAKLTPYAKKKEVAQRALTDRLWHSHLFHPRVRGPISELMAILYEYARHIYKEDFTKYQIDKRRHFIDVNTAQEYQIHHFRYVSRILGMEGVALFSPYLSVTRERMAKRTTEPAPEPTLGVEICHTEPACLKVGGKFFSETGQKEVYYMLGRSLALLRPELALSQRLSAERLEAVFQAALSLSVDRFRFTADPRALDAERRVLEKTLPEPARAALSRVTREYVKSATPNDLRNYLEGAELSAVRTGLFVAGEIEPVKKMVLGENGAAFRVQPRSKIRDLMVFALGEDLHALRVAVGTHVEVLARR
jgi:tetratricopeptide (TPR) repeat protein